MREKIDQLLEMLSPDFDWEKHWEKREAETLEEVFKKCVKLVSADRALCTGKCLRKFSTCTRLSNSSIVVTGERLLFPSCASAMA